MASSHPPAPPPSAASTIAPSGSTIPIASSCGRHLHSTKRACGPRSSRYPEECASSRTIFPSLRWNGCRSCRKRSPSRRGRPRRHTRWGRKATSLKSPPPSVPATRSSGCARRGDFAPATTRGTPHAISTTMRGKRFRCLAPGSKPGIPITTDPPGTGPGSPYPPLPPIRCTSSSARSMTWMRPSSTESRSEGRAVGAVIAAMPSHRKC